MLMVVDIGNTNIVVGLYHGTDLVRDWRIFTDPRRTDDEYGSILHSLFRDAGVAPASIEKTVLSSVVPKLIDTFTRMIEKLVGRAPIVLGPSLYDRLPVTVPESALHEIGTDLICDAVSAWNHYRSSCIVVDFGTALTFTAIGDTGDIRGVAIAPGLGTALNALFRDTAQLPSVPLEVPPSSLGTNTIHSIQAGVVLGYQGLVESLVARIRADLKAENRPDFTRTNNREAPVVATGGLASVLSPVTAIFDRVDPMLTLEGLRLIAGMVD